MLSRASVELATNMTMVKPQDAEFGFAYDGKALAENTMDVRDLAPSLIALGELFERANEILNGEKVAVSLKVQATKPGSFELALILKDTFLSTTQFLTSDMVTSACALLTLVLGGKEVAKGNLFKTIKSLKGQKPEAIEGKNGVTLKASNIELFIPTEVYRLYKDDKIKSLSQAVIEPLFREGIDKIIVKDHGKEVESVTKDDAPSFTFSSVESAEGEENIIPRLALRLIAPNLDFKPGKWKLNDGGGTKYYAMLDDRFLNEVRDRKRRFGVGDYLI